MIWFTDTVIFWAFTNLVFGQDAGFDLFFQTNLEEMNDVEIHFDKPPQEWIKGTLVRLSYCYRCLAM